MHVSFRVQGEFMVEVVRPIYPGNVYCPGTRLVWSLKAALSVINPGNLDLRRQANVVLRTMTALHSTVHFSLHRSRDRLQKCIDELLLCHETALGKKLCAYNNEHKWTAQPICVNGVTLKTDSKAVETYLENALQAILHDRVFLEELDNAVAVGREHHSTSLDSLYHLSIQGVPLRHFGLHEVDSLIARFLRFYNFADDDELRVFMNNLLERVQGLCAMISNPMQDRGNMAVTWFIYNIDFIRRYVELHPMEVDQLWPRINVQEYADATRVDYVSVRFFCSKIIAHVLLKWRLAFAMGLKARAHDDPRGPNNSLVRMLNPDIIGRIYGVDV
jgi:hypothetical protein